MKTDMLANLATGVLAVCAVVVTSLLVRREFSSSDPKSTMLQVPRSDTVADWREYAVGGHTMGPKDAPVTVVTFSDFQCPACRMLADSLRVLHRKHPKTFRVVYRHFPLPNHRFALEAARASECAAEQGRFQQFHDALYAEQAQIGATSWRSFASKSGVPDLSSFEGCIQQVALPPSLVRDTVAAGRLGVRSTPTLLINGARIEGALPLTALERYILRELRRVERSRAPPVSKQVTAFRSGPVLWFRSAL